VLKCVNIYTPVRSHTHTNTHRHIRTSDHALERPTTNSVSTAESQKACFRLEPKMHVRRVNRTNAPGKTRKKCQQSLPSYMHYVKSL
jgi:hypothetical protein